VRFEIACGLYPFAAHSIRAFPQKIELLKLEYAFSTVSAKPGHRNNASHPQKTPGKQAFLLDRNG
jgi:hypothetical protein